VRYAQACAEEELDDPTSGDHLKAYKRKHG
jgi:hypothetical protein